MSYDKWRRRLAGEKVETFTQPDEQDEGYYRKPITEKQPNGRNRIVGWIAIAYFVDPFIKGQMRGVIGDRDMIDAEVDDLWTWCVQYPITEEVYRAVAEHGEPWPDVITWMERDETTKSITLMPPGIGHNNPPPDEALAPEILMAEKIENAMKASPDLKFIESDEQAALVAGSRNRLLELKGEADKQGKALYEPPYAEYKRHYNTWSPLVKRAETAAADKRRLLLNWEQKKRDAEKASVEAAQRAADRAIVAGIPESPPLAPATPAPKSQVKATYGRAMPVQEKTFVVIDDWGAAIKFFRDSAELADLIQRLAQRATDAGIVVPGTHTRKGVI